MMIFPFTPRFPIAVSSASEKILPIGLRGVLITIILLRSVMTASSSAMSKVHSEDEVVVVEPFLGG